MEPGEFVNIQNYVNLFKDNIFIKALKNNLWMVAGSLAAHLGLALILANICLKRIKGSHFFQTVFFFPCVICGVAVGLLWRFVYHQELAF